jgi:hypothetical protein
MQDSYFNMLGSERTVEIQFVVEKLNQLSNENNNLKMLDVGGVPSTISEFQPVVDSIRNNNINYKVADFRGGDYVGDFVTIDIPEQFDACMFLSSLEHFPQCTEGDMQYRDKEDVKGFKKSLSILKENGYVILTVPFGEYIWQPYHQNYDYNGLLELTKGSSIKEQYFYRLEGSEWLLTKDYQTLERTKRFFRQSKETISRELLFC